MFGHQLALLAFQIKEDHGLPFAQGVAHPQDTCLLRGVITVVGTVAADEVFNRRVRVSGSSWS